MKLISKCLFTLSAFLVFQAASAQTPQIVQISTEGVLNSDNCQEPFILTDSDADNGNYEENEDYEITLCFNDIEMSDAQVQILPTNPVTGSVWDVDASSSLFIYEGTGTAGILLGEFNSISDPNGVYFTTASQCLTFVFVSGAGSSGMGFVAEVSCVGPLQPFDFDIVPEPPLTFSDVDVDGIPDDAKVLTICYGDSIHLNALLSFPLSDATGNGYEQSIESTLITYNWGDNSSESGLGLVNASHAYVPFGGFYIYITAQDEMGRLEFTEIFVLVAPRPDFSGLLLNDTLCAGDTTFLTGGILELDTVGVGPSTGLINVNYEFNDSLALPDGSGVLYSTTIDIAGYAGTPILSEPEDLVSICVNVEHSYLGDLEAWITCPNGSTALLFDGFGGAGQYPDGQNGFGGGNTFLGDPVDNDGTPNVQGAGFDYCFSDFVPDLGTMEEEYDNGNTVPVTTGNAMVSGTYVPAETFENLEGCPLNGPWTLSFADNIGSDNGFIFGWDITFSDEFAIDSIFYSPDIVDAYWLDNPDIVENNDTIITVVPSQAGNNAFTFVAEDSFGCLHDTTFQVYVRPQVIAGPDNIACDLTYTLTAQNAPAGGEWVLIDAPTPTAEVVFENLADGVANITATEYGIYTFEITEENCGYQDQTVVDFRPDPVVQPLVSDTVLCVGGSFILDAGPQEANSDNFNINWTRNNNTFNTEDYAVEIDETGLYVITIIGACGTASDTANVVAIELNFEGDTLCALETFQPVNVSLSPEGQGQWTTSASNISFSDPTGLSSFITSTQYGGYNVTFTDSRCPEDGLTRNFQFVEQPTVEVLPENPEFCVDSDSLVVTTSVSGNNTGNFFWTISGQGSSPVISQNDSIFFGPESFLPLEVYIIQAQVFDNFGVCNVASGSLTFEGVWCEYNIPNVITPNGDGQNDLFVVEFMPFFPGTQLTIRNRWGNVVFDQDNYDNYQEVNGGWDPEDLSEGVYFYELRIPQVNKIETGNLTILRN